MFPRVLMADDKQTTLELDWWGLGALQLRRDTRLASRADESQTEFFHSAQMHLRSLVKDSPSPDREVDELYRAFAKLLEHAPGSMQWRGAAYEGPEEFAKLALEASRSASSTAADRTAQVAPFTTKRALS